MHDLSYHNNVTVLGTYRGVRERKEIEPDLLFRAIRKLIERHPALTVTVGGKDAEAPFFTTLRSIDLAEVISWKQPPEDADRDEWRANFLSAENSTGFASNALPLWRLTVLQWRERGETVAQDLVFTYHHLIADGKSGLAAHASILESLNQVTLEEDQTNGSNTTVEITPQELLPSMDTIFGWTRSQSPWLFQKALKWIFPPQRATMHDSTTWAGAPHNLRPPICTMNKVVTFDKAIVERLVRRCEAEHTTINPFFQTLVGSILFHVVPEAESLVNANAMCIRRFIPSKHHIDDSKIGLWISSWHERHSRAQLHHGGNQAESRTVPMPWDAARESRRRIEAELAKGARDLEVEHVKGSVAGLAAAFKALDGRERANSYSVTNLGAFQPPPAASVPGAWSLTGLVFSQSIHATGSALQFAIVTLQGGGMAVTINWQDGIVGEENVEKIRQILEIRVKQIANE